MLRHVKQSLSPQAKTDIARALLPLRELAAWPVSGNLDALARVYGTDKSSRHHDYMRHYARHLPGRRTVKSLLEIGVGGLTSYSGYDTPAGGMSLRTWRRYFPNAAVVGIDIMPKAVRGNRISFEHGSQDDEVFLREVAGRRGPFDVVIDDGSHVGHHIITSFEVLFPFLKSGGLYVIEDLATSYQGDWQGGPPGTAGTQVEFLKSLLDAVLHKHWGVGVGAEVAEVHVYDEIAFIVKV